LKTIIINSSPMVERHMSAHCQVTGRGPAFGNTVAHSHRRTRRRWNPTFRPRRISCRRSGAASSCGSAPRASRSSTVTASRRLRPGSAATERRSDGGQRYSVGCQDAFHDASPRPVFARNADGQEIQDRQEQTRPKTGGALRRTASRTQRRSFDDRPARRKSVRRPCPGYGCVNWPTALNCRVSPRPVGMQSQSPADFLIRLGESGVWVDSPAHLTGELTRYWSV
jgi:ribosomal protein L28